mgnify:CR=1 FL=1
MRYDCEYTITIKLNNLDIQTGHTDEQLKQKIAEEGKRRINAYLSGYLFDPEKKIIFEETNFKLKTI